MDDEKIFFSIAEVAEKCGVEKHVVRFWESEFPEIKPDRRQGRRYFRQGDIDTILRIKDLLWRQGFTIKGAKKALRGKRLPPPPPDAAKTAKPRGLGRQILEKFSFKSEDGDGGGEAYVPPALNNGDFILAKLEEIDNILKN